MAKAKNGNVGKHDCYALAYDMINEAIERYCPLQAIAIEESILTDRIVSTLNVGGVYSRNTVLLKTLGSALDEWDPCNEKDESRHNANRKYFDEEMNALYPALREWWKMRNSALHGLAKSNTGESPSIPAEEFREFAQYVAVKGRRLAKSVNNWTSKQIRRSKSSEANALHK